MWGQEKHPPSSLKHLSKYSLPRNPMAPPVTQPLYTAFFQSDLPLCWKLKTGTMLPKQKKKVSDELKTGFTGVAIIWVSELFLFG